MTTVEEIQTVGSQSTSLHTPGPWKPSAPSSARVAVQAPTYSRLAARAAAVTRLQLAVAMIVALAGCAQQRAMLNVDHEISVGAFVQLLNARNPKQRISIEDHQLRDEILPFATWGEHEVAALAKTLSGSRDCALFETRRYRVTTYTLSDCK